MTDSEKPLKKRKARMISRAAGRATYLTELRDLVAPFIRAGVSVKVRPHPFRATCGAATRKGEPCKCFALANGRCRLHGGLSSGPKTNDGWARTRAGYAAWRARQKAAKSLVSDKT